jgi:hypothetical protein
MTEPVWPFSWPSPPGWGTELDEAAAIIAASPRAPLRQWTVKTYSTEAPGIYGEATHYAATPAPNWCAVVYIKAQGRRSMGPGSLHSLGWFMTLAEAKAAVDEAVNEHQVAGS